MTHGSLFSGVGCADLALDRCGIATAWGVEIEPTCNAVRRRHFPDAAQFNDVREVGAHNLSPVDVITYGSPCQDFSVAGKRAGIEGERSGLFYEATRIIRELRERDGTPNIVVWENVPGVFSAFTDVDPYPPSVQVDGGRWETDADSDFIEVLSALAELRPVELAWRVYDAQWFGVAQRRRRVFLVSDFEGERASEILSLAESLRGYPAPRREAGEGVAGTVESRVGGGGFPGTDGACSGHVVADTLAGGYMGGGGNRPGVSADSVRNLIPSYWDGGQTDDTLDASMAAKQQMMPDKRRMAAVLAIRTAQTRSNGCGFSDGTAYTLDSAQGQAIAFKTDQAISLQTDVTPKWNSDVAFTLKQPSASGGGQPAAVCFQPRYFTRDNKPGGAPSETADITNCKKAGDSAPVVCAKQVQWASGGGQVENDTAQALRAGAEHNYQFARTGMQVRRLTPRECERLMGLPDDWTAWGVNEQGERVSMSDSARYRMCGNGIAVPCMEYIGRGIVKALEAVR